MSGSGHIKTIGKNNSAPKISLFNIIYFKYYCDVHVHSASFNGVSWIHSTFTSLLHLRVNNFESLFNFDGFLHREACDSNRAA